MAKGVAQIREQLKRLERITYLSKKKAKELESELNKRTWIRVALAELHDYLLEHSSDVHDRNCNPLVVTSISEEGVGSNSCFIGVGGKYGRRKEDEGKVQVGAYHFREDIHVLKGYIYVHYQGMLWGKKGDSFRGEVVAADRKIIDVEKWIKKYRENSNQ